MKPTPAELALADLVESMMTWTNWFPQFLVQIKKLLCCPPPDRALLMNKILLVIEEFLKQRT